MFLVCGEALMDVFAGAPTAAGVQVEARIGGSPLNTAIGLARQGCPVHYLGSLSTDAFGDRLLAALQAEGIEVGCVQRTEAPTALSVVSTNEAGVPAYAFHGHGCSDRVLAPVEPMQLPAGIQAIHLASYSAVLEPVGSQLRALAASLRAHGALVSYDPNVRLRVEPDVARWRHAVHAMQRVAHVLKISDEDLDLLWPGLPVHEFAAQCLDLGVQLVVVTRGARGAAGWTHHAEADDAGCVVEVVDTVGAGDTVNAALLAHLAETGQLSPRGLSALQAPALAAALRFANRAAAVTCSRRGADLPRRADLA